MGEGESTLPHTCITECAMTLADQKQRRRIKARVRSYGAIVARPISNEDVYSAVEQLVGDGLPPTQANVRRLLGGKGSGPTLSRGIDSWFREFGPLAMPLRASAGPASLMAKESAREVASCLETMTVQLKTNPHQDIGELFRYVLERAGSLLENMLAWECELDQRAADLEKLRASLTDMAPGTGQTNHPE